MYKGIGKLTESEKRLHILRYSLCWMPRWLIVFFCYIAGVLLYSCAVQVRKRVLQNLSDLARNASPTQIRHYCRTYFYHLCITMYEILVDSPTLDSTKNWRFKAEEESCLEEALQHGRGAILFTSHTGNFFYYYWYLSRKYPCLTVATAGSAELRPLYLMFEQLGCKGLDYDAVPPLQLLRTLRRHLEANGVVLLLGDFWRPAFPPARFFGRNTRSPSGTAVLGIEQRVPVVPFYGFRMRGFRHVIKFEKPLYLDDMFNRHERTEATNALNRILEKTITENPAQWFYWFNADERWETNQTQMSGSHNQ
ncbi:lysophospholipid acyltransferase family protein [Aneurinibacillus sp. Ricciae_BoGa-3]|uniref:lysophospholipid acyltransferase family protein n=1 Tax=Aneurinibacillus sp. Ricciae_BoGa-3 TaxID=3022697 RepID=UPI00233FD81C|nr:lysophospholipid acyltransferase family protein [Aneurinibacillus sp. Ricciae_BoGa-3]WCK54879.1 lysophospholipid acyltransferase family protein [Aneurinibacillus sp. Ricciae_BoGa-3]